MEFVPGGMMSEGIDPTIGNQMSEKIRTIRHFVGKLSNLST